MLSGWTKIESGVRQGHIFSPGLFNLYSKTFLRKLEDILEFIIDGCNNIRQCTNGKCRKKTERTLKQVSKRLLTVRR